MTASRPVVVHPEESIVGPTTPGSMELRNRLDHDGRWVGWSGWIRNEAGHVSGWHHLAANDTYVYVVRGSVTIEFGPGGAERVEGRASDLLLVPSRTIHREAAGPDADLEAFVLRVGGEPEHIDVDGPEGASR